uniref:Uncharacterized protein n=1 Tax=Peronospora matthiolae TaxID=2874970 RepID=A0AAV1TUG4_9STRA
MARDLCFIFAMSNAEDSTLAEDVDTVNHVCKLSVVDWFLWLYQGCAWKYAYIGARTEVMARHAAAKSIPMLKTYSCEQPY